jgi:hypothetical protein
MASSVYDDAFFTPRQLVYRAGIMKEKERTAGLIREEVVLLDQGTSLSEGVKYWERRWGAVGFSR